MDYPIVILLIVVTLGAALAFSLYSRKKTREELKDENAPKSTLAKDKDSTGKPKL
ncbi:hypothetical protein [Marivita sp. GX14005]|uniref:hypothetical protein n=1 Tax=Marivita sp. GX14005 TaxID=2942276 RepID=UPI002018B947|nr:hypothetical protein [Marivita sp. GX14005]MCL3882424.1 hypothetical protein [Marivita sp. GX14005]